MLNQNEKEFDVENEKLTIEEYRKIKGFKSISQKEYDIISDFMYEFSQMLFKNEFN